MDAVTRDPRIWIINVHGPGGVGKSAIVNWVTYKFYEKREFEAIIHLTAKETMLTQDGIRPCSRSLYSLENLLDHVLLAFEEGTSGDLDAKKASVMDILSAWSTLLVLDNMETVADGRILNFIQRLPVGTKAKVILTSRHKTGGWELPLPVGELRDEEIREFVRTKSREMGVVFPTTRDVMNKVADVSGGLPLAIQWMIGRYKLVNDISTVLTATVDKDSPVLEFSFRNMWAVLSPDARSLLAAATVFEAPPTTQQLSIATNWTIERTDKATSELCDSALMTSVTAAKDGRIVFAALPITLSFARIQLGDMGDFELRCRQRVQQFNDQMDLQQSEVQKFKTIFESYSLSTNNEKRAAILCRRGESERFFGNGDSADDLFKQARELAPQSSYVLAMSASYELEQGHIGKALDFIQIACTITNSPTGALCFTIKAKILDAQHDKYGRVSSLERALEFASDDPVLRHQYGVALSKVGRTDDAIEQFTQILDPSKDLSPKQEIITLTTRALNYQRIGREDEARLDEERIERIRRDHPYLS